MDDDTPGVTLHHGDGTTEFLPGNWEVSVDYEMRNACPHDPEWNPLYVLQVPTGRRDYTLRLTAYSDRSQP